MIDNRVLFDIQKNPLKNIFQKSKNRVAFLFIYKDTRFETYHDSFLDAIEHRDNIYKEWYGQDMYAAIQEIYSDGIGPLKKLRKIGPYYINDAGEIYGRNLKPIKPSTAKRMNGKFTIMIKTKKSWNDGCSKIALDKDELFFVLGGGCLCTNNRDMSPNFIRILDGEFCISPSFDGEYKVSKYFPDGYVKCTKRGNKYYQSACRLYGKKTISTTFKDESEARLFSYDLYYYKRGYKHPRDKR